MARPKAYDGTAMLDRAMEVFWARGFDGTSIQNLVGKTGVNRGSLYGAYPDKRALFLASIRRYLELVVEDNVRRLLAVEPAGDAVRQFFLQLVEAPPERLRRGCLLTNSAVELGMEDAQVAALIRGAFRRVEQVFCARLVEAKRVGQLTDGVQPEALARLLITVLQGIRVMSRVGADRVAMRDAVKSALSGIKTAATHAYASGRGAARHSGHSKSGRTRRARAKQVVPVR
ncbi:MAG: TetR/AcrR family transcriptional regulator [Betaproteobacteria bacterium]|nr:TetR/AcrR family transcriptional regulator [Betaproteobacteria bacterium]